MKIISGKYKGRNLNGYSIEGTRPTMDRVKESLFAMIQNYVSGSNCLDLFAGSGNLGLEAISEGASCCTFIDNNKVAIKTINENLSKFDINNCKVYLKDFNIFLKETNEKYDLIFIDPPYKTDYIKKAIILIEKYDLLKNSGLMILESDDESKLYCSDSYDMFKEKKYGDKFIWILRKK